MLILQKKIIKTLCNSINLFSKKMEERGTTVLTVREILSFNCETNVKDRVELEELAVQSKLIFYKIAIIYDMDEGNDVQQSYTTDEYKRNCLSSMGVNDIVDLILMGPRVKKKNF
jgi:hypothetical protein